MRIISERHDKDCYRLKDETGLIVGFALRLSNGKWGLADTSEKQMTKTSFDTVDDVRASMQRRVGVNGLPQSPSEFALVRALRSEDQNQ